MRIWVTGLAGFLGSHLADALAINGHTVAGNDTLVCGSEDNAKDVSSWSLTDCKDFDGMLSQLNNFKPDTLVHAAATAHEGLSVFSPSFITSNIYGASVATFSAAIAAGVKHIVYMSSMSRYGHGEPLPPPFKEDVHTTAPVDPYGIAKVAAEKTLIALCEAHNVKWSIVVPHNIIGVRQRYNDPYRNVASIMINRCKQGKPPIIYGDGLQKRCFSPVKDCLQSLLKIVLEEKGVGQVINIGPDNGEITINQLAGMVMELAGYSGSPEYYPDRPCEVKEAFCSSEKARRLLGYKPEQDIYSCLAEMVRAITPKPFDYSFPLEIVTEKTPKTWSEKLI